jgi:HK97 family phage major capsid protein
MKTFKQFLAEKGVSEDQWSAKSAEEMAALHKEYNEATQKEIDAAIKGKVSKEDVESLITKAVKGIEGFATSEEVTALKDSLREVSEAMENFKTKGVSLKDTLANEIETKKDSIKAIIKGSLNESVVIKAPTTRASIANNTDALRLPDIGQLGVKERSLYNIFPRFPVAEGDHRGVVRYHDWDEATTVRATAMIAEGVAFPESTAKFQEFSLDLKKIGDTLPVSEEFGSDSRSAAAELEMFLDTNVETKIDDQIANGDGVGNNLTGLIVSAPAYTATASSMQSPNIYDLVKKVRTDIVKGRGSKYRPDFVAMNAETIDDLELEKDANGNYIFRNERGAIGSVFIVEDNNVPDNQLVVGDRRFARIYEMGGVELSKGLIGNQFAEDMATLKARKRLLFLIRNVDKTGFRKVTDITAALTTLAKTPV